MNSFLLVIEIHAFKVSPSHMTMCHHTDLYLDQMGESQRVGHGSIGWSIKSANLVNSFFLATAIHGLASNNGGKMAENGDLWLNQMEEI